MFICKYISFFYFKKKISNLFNFITIHRYSIASIFRAWVSKEEGKITRASFIAYVVFLGYVVLSFIVFSTIFAVQPDPKVRSFNIQYTSTFDVYFFIKFRDSA